MAGLSIAANNGDIGGGEIMQIAMALAAQDLGVDVQVVGMRKPDGLVDLSREKGLQTVVLPADGRRRFMRELRQWRRANPEGVLWCNGLVPGAATAGMPRRVIHLHRVPESRGQRALAAAARWRTLATFVPSRAMATGISGVSVLPNWTRDLSVVRPRTSGDVVRIGFIGRTTLDKGIAVLADALASSERPVELVIAGETRFTDDSEKVAVERALQPIADRVERLGWARPEEFFASIDIAVFPSVCAETFGLVVAEAMAMSVPFIISDAGALPEVAGPNHPWIARAGDAASLATAIDAALNSSQQYRKSVTGAARTRWETQYAPDVGRRRFAREWQRVSALAEGRRS